MVRTRRQSGCRAVTYAQISFASETKSASIHHQTQPPTHSNRSRQRTPEVMTGGLFTCESNGLPKDQTNEHLQHWVPRSKELTYRNPHHTLLISCMKKNIVNNCQNFAIYIKTPINLSVNKQAKYNNSRNATLT